MENAMKMDGMLTIKMAVTLPTTTARRKRVVLAKSWCKRDEADSVFGKFLSVNEHINPTLLCVEWIAQDMVFGRRVLINPRGESPAFMENAK
jgi:hypothetical protein